MLYNMWCLKKSLKNGKKATEQYIGGFSACIKRINSLIDFGDI